MAIQNKNGYHRVGFAYVGNEQTARIVVETWKDKSDRDAEKEPLEILTYEFNKFELNYFKDDDYVMYNYDKSKENCEDDFVIECYNFIKKLDKYKNSTDI